MAKHKKWPTLAEIIYFEYFLPRTCRWIPTVKDIDLMLKQFIPNRVFYLLDDYEESANLPGSESKAIISISSSNQGKGNLKNQFQAHELRGFTDIVYKLTLGTENWKNQK